MAEALEKDFIVVFDREINFDVAPGSDRNGIRRVTAIHEKGSGSEKVDNFLNWLNEPEQETLSKMISNLNPLRSIPLVTGTFSDESTFEEVAQLILKGPKVRTVVLQHPRSPYSADESL